MFYKHNEASSAPISQLNTPLTCILKTN